jgi:hypothetical protein
MFNRIVVALALWGLTGWALAGSGLAQGGGFTFGVVGDIPYTTVQAEEFKRVMAGINRADLAFVVHVGDFEADPRLYERNPKAADMPCTDENFATVLKSFQGSKHPFILTPGDNDWADCHELKARKVDPLERLAKLRTMFFPEGKSLGLRTLPVQSQSADPAHSTYRENLTWSMGGVVFATVHIVGSDDNVKQAPEEQKARTAANVAWMQRAFTAARASGAKGLVLMTQANPGFENRWTRRYAAYYVRGVRGAEAPAKPEESPYDGFLEPLIAEMQTFDKPVLFIHGDTHIYRTGFPLVNPKTQRFFDNFLRLETYGWPESGWVRVTVDPADPHLFTIRPEFDRENSPNHPPK